jgi:hypothetical protein
MVLTCPFCIRQIALQDTHYRCMNSECKGMGPDALYAVPRGYNPTLPVGRVLIPGKQTTAYRGGIICDVCGERSTTRICQHCHQELSQDAGQLDQHIIAIIGGRATGKSHYIASLINRLQNEVALNFDASVRMMGEETRRRWKNDFHTPLFVKKELLRPNRPASVDASVRTPLMFRFKFEDGSRQRALSISFFDAAGEDMASLSKMSVYNRYICYADGIIFLLDPLQISSVRHLLPPTKLPDQDLNASPEYIVNDLRELFEREHNLSATQKVKVPIAFTLSKVDALMPILDPASVLRRPSRHSGWLDLYDVQSVDTEISSYLTDWIHPAFMKGIRSEFEYYNFFGVSSLGGQPENNHLSVVSPLRVEDPFLWLLYKLKLIKGKKRW